MPKIQIIFYSMYGHVYTMAEAVAEGCREVEGAQVELLQVPELVSEAALERTGAKAARARFAHVPMAQVERLPEADAIMLGVPTRYGNMAAQMRNFLDQTGKLWASGALIGKIGSIFTSTASQHGGQETTILTGWTTLCHHGMVIVGCPYSCTDLNDMSEILGGSPYGAATVTGGDGSRQPSEIEKRIARFQGRHVATLAKKLAG